MLAVPAFAVLAALKVRVVDEPAVSVAKLSCVLTPVGTLANVRLNGEVNAPCVTVQDSFVVID
jgi:hypothetical protein